MKKLTRVEKNESVIGIQRLPNAESDTELRAILIRRLVIHATGGPRIFIGTRRSR